jgi:hypothetical protein
MNAHDRIFVTAGMSAMAARIIGVAAAGALLSGCAGFRVASVKVDPNSPVAAEVARVAGSEKTPPQFSNIPPAPTDIRPVRLYGQRAAQLEAARTQLETATAPSTWTLGNTQGFMAQARGQAGPDYNAATASDAEAFADTVRKRATPPPPGNP